MKNSGGLSGLLLVFALIILVCAACEQELDNNIYTTRETWNGIKFRQYRDITDNQYEITANKFKAVFDSNSFTDEERAKLKNHISAVHIYCMNGGWGGGWFYDPDSDKLILSVPCDSIQDVIEATIRGALEGIDAVFYSP